MIYTIIGFKNGYDAWRNRERDYENDKPMECRIKSFRENEREAFMQEWAHEDVFCEYDHFEILLNGINEHDMTDQEWEEFSVLEKAIREQYIPAVRAAKVAAEAEERERRANAAVEQARRLAAQNRENDLRAFNELKRKLNM
jgi:hypothetical protein